MANKNSIINFKNGFNGGTRANRFQVIPSWPTKVPRTQDDATYKMVSASLPGTQINTIAVPYRGRTLLLPGDRQYSTWAVGMYDDNNTQNLWKAMHTWSELMDGHYNHLVDSEDYNYDSLQTTWKIKQLDLNGDLLKTITLYKCWPSVVGEMELNMGDAGFSSFSATLTFDYIRIQDNYNS
jgi:hypothetical protein